MSKIIEVALQEIGETENPPNSNISKYNTWFGLLEQPWCAMFVSWCYYHAGFPITGMGYPKGYAGCQTAYNYFLKNNLIVTHPQPGDIVLFDWNGDHRYDHTGIFVKWIDEVKGIFESIEGNTSSTNNSNGGNVELRRRNKSLAIFAHIK